MEHRVRSESDSGPSDVTTLRTGFLAAGLLAFTTVVTFGLALVAVPISGPFCPEGCIDYPYLDTLAQFPKDYLWMFPASLLVLVYVVLVTAIHTCTAQEKKVFSHIGLSISMMGAAILLLDYFVQFSVIPVSLMNGETDGVPIWTQYNPHGLFIALEELGFLLMSLSFLFLSLVFSRGDRLESSVRWVFLTGFVLTIASLVMIVTVHGIDRSYLFEVAVISIDWLVLTINGILLSLVFRRRLKRVM